MAILAGARRSMTGRWAVIGLCVVGVIVAAGCGSGNGSASAGGGKAHHAHKSVPAPAIQITPATGSKHVRPDLPIRVLATKGHLLAVTMRRSGRMVPGQMNPAGTEWLSRRALAPGTAYVVEATAGNSAGKTAVAESKFRTLRPRVALSASLDWTLAANQGQPYGVGLPIILNFSEPVRNKAAVAKALVVKAQRPVPGAWRWITDQQAVYRADGYWPPHQVVTLHARLVGVRASAGVYGTRNLTYRFRIGVARISTANVRTHHMTVRIDGRVVRSYGISGGDGSSLVYTTPSGTALTMEKARMVIMTNPNVPKGAPGWYREPVPLAVRLTYSGIFVHETPGAEWCLGVANCSHGCVRQPATDALWFYDTNQTADVVRVTGTNRKMAFGDGWTFYQMPWKQWSKGSRVNYASYAPYSPSLNGLRIKARAHN